MHDVPSLLMRLANFEIDGERRLGVIEDGTVVDLSASGLPQDTVEAIAEWDRAKVDHAVGQGNKLPVEQVRLLERGERLDGAPRDATRASADATRDARALS